MSAVLLEFAKIDNGLHYEIASVTLNRPEKANSFNAAMIDELLVVFEKIQKRGDCRLLVLKASGKHFCAGADLEWMKNSIALSHKENLEDATRLSQVFEKLFQLEIPTVAIVQGNAYGGGLGLIACCDFAIARDDSSFSLREVRIGLLPAAILPFLSYKMQKSPLRSLALTGDTFSADEALEYGLLTHVRSSEAIEEGVRSLLSSLLLGSPQAQRKVKKLLKTMAQSSEPHEQILKQCIIAIADARASEEGQRGLNSFLKKESLFWVQELPKTWAF